MNEKYFLAALFTVSFALYAVSSFSNAIRWWDETIYMDLGYTLSKEPLVYRFVGYGDFNPIGEWWRAGFRPPLLPYLLAFFYVLSGELIPFVMPLIGALGVVAAYFLARDMFNRRVAMLSAALLAAAPLYSFFSGRLLNDVFGTVMMTAAIAAFYRGFVKGDKRFRILAGILSGLAFLARYTSAMLAIIFAVYILLFNRKIIRDKYAWMAAAAALAVTMPLFAYSWIEYGDAFGATSHALKAATFWGGSQPWTFFADNWLFLFSLLPFAAVLGVLRTKQDGMRLSTVWLIVAFVCISLLVHKEDRFYLPLLPPLAMLAGAGLDNVRKRFPVLPLLFVAFLAVSSLVQISGSYASYSDAKNSCFLSMMSYIKETVPETGVIYTDDSPVVFAYTKRETRFVPSGLDAVNGSYIIWYSGDSTGPLLDRMEKKFTKVYSCPDDGSIYRMYSK